MLLPITLAAALVATPIPAGAGGAPTPLAVTSDVPGAVAQAKFRDRTGAVAYAECVAPCTLEIPNESAFALVVQAPDGTLLKHERPIWGPGKIFQIPYKGRPLKPSAIHAVKP